MRQRWFLSLGTYRAKTRKVLGKWGQIVHPANQGPPDIVNPKRRTTSYNECLQKGL